jgi:hypothetical protein
MEVEFLASVLFRPGKSKAEMESGTILTAGFSDNWRNWTWIPMGVAESGTAPDDMGRMEDPWHCHMNHASSHGLTSDAKSG